MTYAHRGTLPLGVRRPYHFYTNSFVTFLSWIYWLDAHAFNAAGRMGALL